jgi:hypothetical protein
MENKKLKESDFHKGEGHNIPFFIKLVWLLLISWAIYYLVVYSLPDLRVWLAR